MTDLMKKAKAIASLGAGITVCLERWEEGTDEWNAYQCPNARLDFDQWKQVQSAVADVASDDPIDALAAAADALGLSPDPDILRGGVTLTEDEEEALRWGMAYCADMADKTSLALYWQRAKAIQSLLDQQTKGV